jgi:hypothetical protein
LTKLGIQPKDQKSIVAQQQSHNYQLACIEHFKVAHNMSGNSGVNFSVDNVGNHPNAWFQSSAAYLKANSKEQPSAATTTPGPKGAMKEETASFVSP